ncbi:MAG: VacJ family lipoprotein [Gammaproteobacteria bacterium]|nr:VacJ family lipoprotein [Gammaproteobacteria bacterium]
MRRCVYKNLNKRSSKWLLFICLMIFTRMVFAADEDQSSTAPVDPYEKFNRVVFRFNDTLDRLILKPTAILYNKIIPKPIVKGIRNFFFNIDTIPTVVNDVLQLNIYQATRDTWRLGINTTIGLLGFFDFANDMGLAPNSEDFGLTLAHWGYTHSNYLVIPFFGPGTTRDVIGWPIDYYLFSVYPHIKTPQRYELYAASVVSWRAGLLRFQDVMQQAAIDRYVFVREAYMQHRAFLIQRNKELGDPYLEHEHPDQAS